MSRAYPCLYIKSYDEALPYYVDFLRFHVDFEWRSEEGLPVYMGVSRGASPVRQPGFSDDLVDQPWGKTELHLYDPFRNHLVFTSPTKSDGRADDR